MARFPRIFLTLGLLLLALVPARGATPPWEGLSTPLFTHLGRDSGLPHQFVTALAQDGDGFLWIGTQGGLARWDGYRLRVFQNNPSLPGTLPDNAVFELAVDSAGQLWATTNSGQVVRYDRATERFVTLPLTPEGLGSRPRLALEGTEAVHVGGASGLHRHDLRTGEWRHVRPGEDGLPEGRVFGLALDGSGALLVATEGGLVRRLAGAATFQPVAGAEGLAVRRLRPVSGGNVLFGTRDGVVGLVGNGDRSARVLARLGTPAITDLAEEQPGVYWVAAIESGLLRLDTRDDSIVRHRHDPLRPQGLADDTTTTLLVDRSGLLWAGGQAGVGWHNPHNAAILTLHPGYRDQGLGGKDVMSVAPTAEGLVMLGYQRGLVELFDPVAGRVSPIPSGSGGSLPSTGPVFAFALDGPREGWVGTARGLYRLLPGGTRVQPVEPLGDARIDSLLYDQGTLWVGTAAKGLYRFDKGGKAPVAYAMLPGKPDTLSDNSIAALLRDPAHGLWVGTENGLNLLDPATGRVRRFLSDPTDPAGLPSAVVSTLMLDRKGRLWVGTLGGGIGVLAPDLSGFRRVGTTQGLPSGNVGALLEDGRGRVWASTADGLALIDPESLAVRAFRPADGVSLRTYWVNSAGKLPDGTLLFGGAGGMTAVRPDRLSDWSYVPPVRVTEVRVNGRPVPVRDTLTLQPQERALQVEFAALDFSAPNQNRYAVKLEGYDEDWQVTDADRRLAAYANLPPGGYRLLLRGTNRAGKWAEAPAVLAITVLPAWHQTLWFKALLGAGVVVAALFLAWLVGRRRTVAYRRREQELRGLVAERTAELERRQAELAAANDTLARIGDIGRELTSSLDLDWICRALHQGLAQHLSADCFGVALLDAAGTTLTYVYYVEDGKRPEQPLSYPLDHPTAIGPRCLRDGRDVLVFDEDQARSAPDPLDTDLSAPLRSLVFRPLMHRGRPVGVITIQSHRANAYGEGDLELFRSAATFAASAIANAQAFQAAEEARHKAEAAEAATAAALASLRSAQDQLIQQEKLASLGQLVAGVAHEINTPLGIAITTASHLGTELGTVTAAANSQSLKRSQLTHFLETGQEGVALLTANLTRAAELVASFKQVAADRTSEGSRSLELLGYVGYVLRTVEPMTRRSGVAVTLAGDEGLRLTTFPGPLAQVVTNLVQNAIIHGFGLALGESGAPSATREPTTSPPGASPEIRITVAAGPRPGWAEVTVSDNGKGMPPDIRARAFDPFFTTRRDLGGTGLGLHIVHNIVSGVLGGTIGLDSAPGKGTSFRIRLKNLG